jgi:transposase-like protein
VDQILHGRATTTEAVCRAIQHSQERLRALATRYGGNPKTAFKWRKGSSVSDLPTGPRGPKSSVLSVQEEVEFRRHTLLPLDDCLYALQAAISRLTRSSLRRCLQRHGVSRLPEVEGDKTATKASSKLRAHLRNFVDAYNFARSLKTLKGLTPYQFICKCGTSDPKRFNLDPRHQMPGLNKCA